MGMRIIHSRPADAAITLANSTLVGTDTLSDVKVFSGQPGEVTRYLWGTSGAITTSTYIEYEITWATGIPIGGLAILGITLPAGTATRLIGRAAGSGVFNVELGGNCGVLAAVGGGQRVIERPRGDRRVVFLTDYDGADLDGLQLRLVDDVDGAASIALDTEFEIGEIQFGEATDVDILPDWRAVPVDPTVSSASEDQQPFVARGVVAHDLNFTPALRDIDEVLGDPDDLEVLDFEELGARLDRGQQALFIPRWADEAGELVPQYLHRSALFGSPIKPPGHSHAAGSWFNHEATTAREAPVPV